MIDHPWAGVVRVETLESIGIEAAARLADLTACHLPSFASSSLHDPRAPQNLYPIGGLETQLRHTLGDHEYDPPPHRTCTSREKRPWYERRRRPGSG